MEWARGLVVLFGTLLSKPSRRVLGRTGPTISRELKLHRHQEMQVGKAFFHSALSDEMITRRISEGIK
jgi:hypothetical protein